MTQVPRPFGVSESLTWGPSPRRGGLEGKHDDGHGETTSTPVEARVVKIPTKTCLVRIDVV